MSETLDDETVAGEPGRVRVSKAKLKALEPWLFKPGGDEEDRRWWKTHVKEHLLDGDSRAAVVLSTNPLRVAALTREIDCAAVLKFPSKLAREHELEVGDRLLTVNTYAKADEFPGGHERDLTPGPSARGVWGNFSPMIAEFLSDDGERIEARKAEIDDEEYAYCQELGEAWLEAKRPPRDGRPTQSHVPAPRKRRKTSAAGKEEKKGNGLLYFVAIVVLLGGLRIARKAFKAAKHAPVSSLDEAAEGARRVTRKGVDAGATADELNKARDVADAADTLRGDGDEHGKTTNRRAGEEKDLAQGADYLAQNLLTDQDPKTRAATAQLLGAAKPSPKIVRALARALRVDPDAKVRAQAARALGRLGKAARGVEPELRKALGDRARQVRAQAKWALTQVR